MSRALNWIIPITITALVVGAALLWLERGNAMLLDLSSSIAALLCI